MRFCGVLVVVFCCLGFGCGEKNSSVVSEKEAFERSYVLLKEAKVLFLESVPGSGEEQAVSITKDFISGKDFVQSCGSVSNSIWFIDKDGGTMVLDIEDRDDMLGGGQSSIFQSSNDFSFFVGLPDDLQELFGSFFSYVEYTGVSEADLDGIIDIDTGSDIIYFYGHGGFTSARWKASSESEELGNPTWMSFFVLNQPIREYEDIPQQYRDELPWNSGYFVFKEVAYDEKPLGLGVTPTFFRDYVRDFTSSPLVYFSSCNLAKDYVFAVGNPEKIEKTMAGVFKEKGASVFLGYTDEVSWWTVSNTYREFFGYLLDECMSVDAALEQQPSSSYGYCGPDLLDGDCEVESRLIAYGNADLSLCIDTDTDTATESDDECVGDVPIEVSLNDIAGSNVVLDEGVLRGDFVLSFNVGNFECYENLEIRVDPCDGSTWDVPLEQVSEGIFEVQYDDCEINTNIRIGAFQNGVLISDSSYCGMDSLWFLTEVDPDTSAIINACITPASSCSDAPGCSLDVDNMAECDVSGECLWEECIPLCDQLGWECGDDGCGDACGYCNSPEVCGDENLCEGFRLLSPEPDSTLSGLVIVHGVFDIPFIPSEVDVGYQLYDYVAGLPEVGGRVKMIQVGDSNVFEAVLNTASLSNKKYHMKATVLLPDSEFFEESATFTVQNDASMHGVLFLNDGLTPLSEGNITLSIDGYPVAGATSNSSGEYVLNDIPPSSNYGVRVWKNESRGWPNVNPGYVERIYTDIVVSSGSDLEMDFEILGVQSVNVTGGAPTTDAASIFYNASATGNLGYSGFMGYYDTVDFAFEVEMSEVEGGYGNMPDVSPRFPSDFAQNISCQNMYSSRFRCEKYFSLSGHGSNTSYTVRLFSESSMSWVGPSFTFAPAKVDSSTFGRPHVSCISTSVLESAPAVFPVSCSIYDFGTDSILSPGISFVEFYLGAIEVRNYLFTKYYANGVGRSEELPLVEEFLIELSYPGEYSVSVVPYDMFSNNGNYPVTGLVVN